ncbi:hypothetical protein [Rhodohalobacter sp. 8-1]|uniref:hypothetical protein n=1 Tax=Rhodohalobacter sp. 8-1 TaxID=3131972 RepID=UPI0030EC9B49
MKLQIFLFATLFIISTSCSVTNSDTNSSEIHGKVIDQNGNPINNISIGVVYTFSESEVDPNLKQYPNPFTGATTIEFDLETGVDYKLTAENLETGQKITITDDAFSAGQHQATFFPSENTDVGLIKISDNLGNEVIAFNAPGFPIRLSNTVNTLEVAGKILGDVYTTTSEDGTFSFDIDRILKSQESFLITDPTGTSYGSFMLDTNLYLVAYIDDEIYDVEFIDYEELTNSFEFILNTN